MTETSKATLAEKSDVITIRIPKKALLIAAGIATLGVSALVIHKMMDSDGVDALTLDPVEAVVIES